jgi:tRNA(His) 5'-end guanylyltransferase
MATDKTALGDRMKAYEHGFRAVLPRRQAMICRLDGRAFHSYLRGATKPFDMGFIEDMGHVATALCEEISGAVFAYHQSDEISVLVQDYGSEHTEPWFGGVLQKVVSISAAVATSALSARRPGRPLFDARAFVLPNPVEVANYFLWRQRDAVRNSISMAAQANFSHKQLQGVSSGGMQEMLFAEAGINWDHYHVECRRGQVVVKASGEREVTYTDKRTQQECTTTAYRTWWEVRPAPLFNLEPGGFLAQTIPPMPALAGAEEGGVS